MNFIRIRPQKNEVYHVNGPMRMRVQCRCSHKQVNIHFGVINPPGLMPRINWKADTDVMSVRLGVR